MEKIITPLEIPGPLIPSNPPNGNYFARLGTIYNPSPIPLFYHYLISSVLRLKKTHEFEYIKNQVLTNLGGIGSERLEVVYKKNNKIQYSVYRAKFWLSFINLDYLIKDNSIENWKGDTTTPLLRSPLFKIFTLMEEYKTDINSGKDSVEVGLVGATDTTIIRLSSRSGYFPVIEIQNLLNPLDTVLIKNEKDWKEFILEPKKQFDSCETELMENLSNYYYYKLNFTEVSGKKSNIELGDKLLIKINNYLNNWTRIDYGRVYNHLDLKIFEYLTKILEAIEPRYALVTDNNNINLIKYD